jgi:hypothetical protein
MKNLIQFLFVSLLATAVLFTGCKEEDDTPSVDNITVTGTVSDDSGNALEGVTVDAGTASTTTDAAGAYSISVDKSGALEFSLTDYVTKTEFVQGRTTIDVTLTFTGGSTETLYEETTLTKECDNDEERDMTIVKVTDFGQGTGTMTWTNDKVWVLNSLVFVNEGQTLTIEPGTIIKGASGQGESATALIVARGGSIDAQGTADDPIILTSEADGIFRDANGICTEGGLPATARGLWGGMIVLGKATLNSSPGESAIEGIPTTESRGLYGGSDDADNSGILTYISIRHGGTDIGAGNEINGLTMGGVGNGTTIEHIEVFGNQDDGFEWFGGTVDTKWLVAAYCGDDAMDYDEGWRGRNQYWFVYQEGAGDRGGEHDGGTDPETGTPYATPVILNASYRGRGSDQGRRALTFRDNAGGQYHNSIFWSYGKGVDIEFLGAATQDSHQQYVDGNLVFQNNILFDIAEDLFVTNGDSAPDISSDFAASGNIEATNVPVDSNLGAANDAVSGPFSDPGDAWFTVESYKGAFAPGVDRWTAGWSRLEKEL